MKTNSKPVLPNISSISDSYYDDLALLRKALVTMKKLSIFADLDKIGSDENYLKLVSASAELKAFLDTQVPF